MHRRRFVKNGLIAGALSLIAPSIHANMQRKFISDRVILGTTGLEVSRLAIGTGTSGWGKASNQSRELGIKGLADLLNEGFGMGINFWDTADQYGTHPHIKEALKRVPREKVVILTKTHATSRQEMEDDLERFRKELGTDYIDIILLHMMKAANWTEIKAEAMQVLSEAKEKGIIKAHGVSCHNIEALKTASSSKWVEVDLARMNYAGVVMDSTIQDVRNILMKMHDAGKGVIGMKVLGNGQLSNQVDKSLKFILEQDYIHCFSIGIESYDQLVDLQTRMPKIQVV